MQRRQTKHSDKVVALQAFLAIFWSTATAAATKPESSALSPTNIFAPVSTPAQSIFDLSVLEAAVGRRTRAGPRLWKYYASDLF